MTAEEKLKKVLFYSPFNEFKETISNVAETNIMLNLNYDLYYTEIRRLAKNDNNTDEDVEQAEKYRKEIESKVAKLKEQVEKMEHLLDYI